MQLACRGNDLGGGNLKQSDELVEKLKPTVRIGLAFECAARELVDVPSEYVWLIGGVNLGELRLVVDLGLKSQLHRLGYEVLLEAGGERLYGHSPKLSRRGRLRRSKCEHRLIIGPV